MYVAIAIVARLGVPRPEHRARARAGSARRCSASPSGSRPSCRAGSATRCAFYVGVTGALILLAAVTTSISGFSRLAYSLGEHGQLPRSFGRLSRRAHVSPQAIVAAAADLVRRS